MTTTESSHFFEVKIELFDGPLDLLLHLVKKKELPIEKVSLADVAAQYLGCIERTTFIDLEIAGEYLVIATMLLSIKSSVLLNEPVELVEDEHGNLVDPHEELVLRLKKLEAFRAAAAEIGKIPMLGVDVFSSLQKTVKIDTKLVPLAQHEVTLLTKAFQNVLAKLVQRGHQIDIQVDTVSVVERMVALVETLKTSGGRSSFERLIGSIKNIAVAVSTLLAILELCKRYAVKVEQSEALGEIMVCLGDYSSQNGNEEEKVANL